MCFQITPYIFFTKMICNSSLHLFNCRCNIAYGVPEISLCKFISNQLYKVLASLMYPRFMQAAKIYFLLRRLESNQLYFAYETNMIYISVSFLRNIIKKKQFPFVLTMLFNSRDMEVAALRGLLTNHTLQPFTWEWEDSNLRSIER